MSPLVRCAPNHLSHRFPSSIRSSLTVRKKAGPMPAPGPHPNLPAWLLRLACICLLLIAAPAWLSIASAAQVTLAWDPSDGAAGYRLFNRTANASYDYAQPTWSGQATTCTVELSDATRYYFVVRAYQGDTESADSNEVVYDTPAVNRAPEARAGADQTVAGLTRVTLNGSASTDPDGDTLTYTWHQTLGTDVPLSDSHAARPTFTAPAGASTVRTLEFSLAVRDPDGRSATDTCQVQVAANQPPVAEAGPDQSAPSGRQVRLNGTTSYDPEGGPIGCQWVQTAGPEIQLQSAGTPQPSFTTPALAAGQSATLGFQLTVTDNQAATSTDTCWVEVTAPAPPADQPPVSGGDDPVPGGDDPAPGDNQPPLQPALTYPVDRDSGVELTPELNATAFADPDAGDTHARSEWLIEAQNDARTILNVSRTGSNLTHLQVPRLVLDPDTGYICQVRFFDDRGNPSPWSPAVSFTTRAAEYYWEDNGAAEAQNTPIQTDLNGNVVPDADESDVLKSIQAPDGQHAIAVGIQNSANVVSLDAAVATDPASEQELPGAADLLPYGILSYRIHVREPGQQASVMFYFSHALDSQTIWMGRDENGDWSECGDGVYAQADGVARTITDGGPGDADGAANGVILDQIAPLGTAALQEDPGHAVENTDSGAAADSGGGGCFIASLLE